VVATPLQQSNICKKLIEQCEKARSQSKGKIFGPFYVAKNNSEPDYVDFESFCDQILASKNRSANGKITSPRLPQSMASVNSKQNQQQVQSKQTQQNQRQARPDQNQKTNSASTSRRDQTYIISTRQQQDRARFLLAQSDAAKKASKGKVFGPYQCEPRSDAEKFENGEYFFDRENAPFTIRYFYGDYKVMTPPGSPVAYSAPVDGRQQSKSAFDKIQNYGGVLSNAQRLRDDQKNLNTQVKSNEKSNQRQQQQNEHSQAVQNQQKGTKKDQKQKLDSNSNAILAKNALQKLQPVAKNQNNNNNRPQSAHQNPQKINVSDFSENEEFMTPQSGKHYIRRAKVHSAGDKEKHKKCF